MPSVVTDQEIQREIDTLRSLRRRSESTGGPGALVIDPDLPPPTSTSGSPTSSPYGQNSRSPPSPSAQRRARSGSNASDGGLRSPTSPTGGAGRSLPRAGLSELNGSVDANVAVLNLEHSDPRTGPYENGEEDGGAPLLHVTGGAMAPSPLDDPTHLFWVPAHLHPELAPGEFRAFLKSHTQPEGEAEDFTAPQGTSEAGLAFAGGSGLERRLSAMNRRSSLSRGVSVSGSVDGGGLGRKRSMLSRQYHPRVNDNIEEEVPPVPTGSALGRSGSNRSSIYGGRTGEQNLTLEDLQRLEELADQAAEGGDGDLGKMRNLLRRSLSISTTGSFSEDEGYAGLDENDAPIIIPPRGQILRRTARTKIRKAHLPGDGGGHRFGPSRKGRTGLQSAGDDDDQMDDGRLSPHEFHGRRRTSDHSEDSEEMHSAESGYTPGERVGLRDAQAVEPERRKMSAESTDESAIYDSYSREGDTSVESSQSSSSVPVDDEDESPPKSSNGHDQEWLEHQQQQRTPTGREYEDESRRRIVGERESPDAAFITPPSSPETLKHESVEQQINPYDQLQVQQARLPPPRPAPVSPTANSGPYAEERARESREAIKAEIAAPPPRTSSPVQSLPEKREKEKKGGFFSKKDKDTKGKKEKEKDKKEKDGFLGSLFGGKKKHEEHAPLKFSSAGPAAAAALLGTSKSAKSIGLVPLGQSSPLSPGFNNYARYPIHVERAVYRLSHIKLANPRRPLYEQVLISNLMFWYLSIINRNHNQPTTPPAASAANHDEKKPIPTATSDEKAPGSQGMAEKEAPKSLRSVSGHTPNKGPLQPPANGSSPQSVAEPQLPSKRTGLSKPETRGPSRSRQAEMPIRQPQYGMQLQMEKEYQRPGPSPPQQQQLPQQQQVPRSNTSPPPRAGPPQQPALLQTNKPRQPSLSNDSRDVPPPLIIPAQQLSSDRRQKSPHSGYASPQNADSIRRSTTERMNLSSAAHEPPYPGGPRTGPSPPPPERRGPPPGPGPSSSRGGYPSHSGPQPGQVFQYPSGMVNVQPGQVFPPQIGQVFHHPQYTPAPQGYSLVPPVHANGPPTPGHPYPGGSVQGPPRNLPWSDGSAQLPPGAMPSRQAGSQDQQWMRGPGGSPRQAPAQLYDERRGHQYPDYQRTPSGPRQPPPPLQRGEPPRGPPHPQGPPHRSAPPQQYPQQPYNPYARPEPGQRQPQQQQVVPGMMFDGRR